MEETTRKWLDLVASDGLWYPCHALCRGRGHDRVGHASVLEDRQLARPAL